jgi:hypothetical protein
MTVPSPGILAAGAVCQRACRHHQRSKAQYYRGPNETVADKYARSACTVGWRRAGVDELCSS